MNLGGRCNGTDLIAEIKLCKFNVVVLVLTQLWTENIPDESRRFGKLFVFNFVLLEGDLILHSQKELTIQPLLDIIIVLALSLDDWCARLVHANLIPDDKLSRPCRIIISLQLSIIVNEAVQL